MNDKIKEIICDRKDKVIQKFAEADREAILNLRRKVTVCLDTETGELDLFYGNVEYSNKEYPLHTFLHNEEIYSYYSPADCIEVLKETANKTKLNEFCEAFKKSYVEENGELNETFEQYAYDYELWNAITENPDFEEELSEVNKEFIDYIDLDCYKDLYYSLTE